MELSTDILRQIDKIRSYLSRYTEEGKKVFVSSSFQTHSIPLLHILSTLDKKIPVCFLNTGFHFPETIIFRDEIVKLLDLKLISVESNIPKSSQKDQRGRFFFCSNANYCCHLNKVLPLEPVLAEYDIWITGVRRDQSENRKNMDFEAGGPFNTTRFHPMLDWNAKMIWDYRQAYNLPEHPLEKEGYFSVGCEPCTQKYGTDDRSGRWSGQRKTECGLHTDLISK